MSLDELASSIQREIRIIESEQRLTSTRPKIFAYVRCMYVRMSRTGAEDNGPEIDRINLRISRSFLEVIDESWRERGFNSRSEFIRYALRDAVNHPEGAGFWRDMAISEAEFAKDEGKSSGQVKAEYELDGE